MIIIRSGGTDDMVDVTEDQKADLKRAVREAATPRFCGDLREGACNFKSEDIELHGWRFALLLWLVFQQNRIRPREQTVAQLADFTVISGASCALPSIIRTDASAARKAQGTHNAT